MGNFCDDCTHQQALKQAQNFALQVVTLNYGGILKSPFQFYSDEEQEQKKLSDCFYRLLPIYINSFDRTSFEWDIGKIDQKLQEQRYTPLYNPKVGIVESSKKQMLVTAPVFQELWMEYYLLGTKKTKVEPQPNQTQKKNMKLFDMICYHAIIDYVYNLTSKKKLQDLSKQVENLKPSVYKDFMEKKFSKSFLDENKKIDKMLRTVNKMDVVFIQEPTKLLIERLSQDKTLQIEHNGANQSMVVVRKKNFMVNRKFKRVTIEHLRKENKYFDFNGNTDAVALVVNKFIFISAHLSSKEAKNPGEVKALKQILNRMRTQFRDYTIVLGSDMNSFVSDQGLAGYDIFPKSKLDTTTSKKRTYLQPQFKKANKGVQECKDHIISSGGIRKPQIQTIEGQKAKPDALLPTDEHPFDHLMVFCEIR